MRKKPNNDTTDIITFNGHVGIDSDNVAEFMIKSEGYERFYHVLQAQLMRSSNTKSVKELLQEYADKNDEDLIISFPTAYKYIPESFKVFFINPNKEKNDVKLSNFIVKVDGNLPDEKIKAIVERLTVAYGYWVLGRTPEKIIS